MGGDLVPPG